MNIEEKNEIPKVKELPDDWWYKVYAGVIVTTILVIAALWGFSRYFSS